MKLYITFFFFFYVLAYTQEKKELPCLEIRKFQSKKDLSSITEKIQAKITEQLLELGRYRIRVINSDSKVSSINYNTENSVLGSDQAQKNLNQIIKNSCEQILKGEVKKTPTERTTDSLNRKNQDKYELKITHTETKFGNLLFSKIIDMSEKHIDFYSEEIARKVIDSYYTIEEPVKLNPPERNRKIKNKKKSLGSKIHPWFNQIKEKNKKDFEKEKRKTIP